VDECPKMGATTRTSGKKEAMDGEMVEGLHGEWFFNGCQGGGGGEGDDGGWVVVIGWDELSGG
jgi:hypothetical protein